MATPAAQPDAEALSKNQRAERQATAIAAFVMGALGQPADFRRVTVARLWGNRFRVNVHTGDGMSTRVAHSFFLAADENGRVIESDPAIARLY
jgi:hypothetical protein